MFLTVLLYNVSVEESRYVVPDVSNCCVVQRECRRKLRRLHACRRVNTLPAKCGAC